MKIIKLSKFISAISAAFFVLGAGAIFQNSTSTAEARIAKDKWCSKWTVNGVSTWHCGGENGTDCDTVADCGC